MTDKCYISYKDDNGEIIGTMVELVSIDDFLITFKTERNEVTINKNRLIKLKRGLQNE